MTEAFFIYRERCAIFAVCQGSAVCYKANAV